VGGGLKATLDKRVGATDLQRGPKERDRLAFLGTKRSSQVTQENPQGTILKGKGTNYQQEGKLCEQHSTQKSHKNHG